MKNKHMSIYHNITNDMLYTLQVVEAIPPMIEATPYMGSGQVIKYPVLSSKASDFVELSPEAIEAYEKTKQQ